MLADLLLDNGSLFAQVCFPCGKFSVLLTALTLLFELLSKLRKLALATTIEGT